MEQFSGDSCSGGNKCPGGTSLGENCLGGNLLWEIVQKLFRDNFLWGKSPGGNCPGGNFMSSNCPEGSFPGGWGGMFEYQKNYRYNFKNSHISV